MVDFKNKTLLVIAPHPDDEVIGCAGLIQNVKARGGKVYVLFLTVAESSDFSSRGYSTTEERVGEIKRVADLLQFDGWRIAFAGNKYHLKLDGISQKDIIHEIENGEDISLEAVRPDVIAFPILGDYNQDHRATAEACFAACRPAPRNEKFIPDIILSSEAPMSSWSHSTEANKTNFIIEITREQIERKMRAMNEYSSQVRNHGHPRHVNALHALAVLRGSEIGTAYGEAFVCHKFRVSQDDSLLEAQLQQQATAPATITVLRHDDVV